MQGLEQAQEVMFLYVNARSLSYSFTCCNNNVVGQLLNILCLHGLKIYIFWSFYKFKGTTDLVDRKFCKHQETPQLTVQAGFTEKAPRHANT